MFTSFCDVFVAGPTYCAEPNPKIISKIGVKNISPIINPVDLLKALPSLTIDTIPNVTDIIQPTTGTQINKNSNNNQGDKPDIFYKIITL